MDRVSIKKQVKPEHRAACGLQQTSTVTQFQSFTPFSRDQFYDTKYLQRLRSDVQRLENERLIPTSQVTAVKKANRSQPAADRKSNEVLLPQLPIQDQRSISRFSKSTDKNTAAGKQMKRFPCSKIGLSELPSLNVSKKPVTPTPNKSELHAEKIKAASRINDTIVAKPSSNRAIRPTETSMTARKPDHGARTSKINHFVGVNGPTRPLGAITSAMSNAVPKSILHNMETLSICGERIQPVSPTPSQISLGVNEPQRYTEGYSPTPSVVTLSRRGSDASVISFMNDVPLGPYMVSSAQMSTTPSVHYYRASPTVPQTVYLLSKQGSAQGDNSMQMIEYTSLSDPFNMCNLTPSSISSFQPPASRLSTCDISTQTPRLESSPQRKAKKNKPKLTVKKTIVEKRRKDKRFLRRRSRNNLKLDNHSMKSGTNMKVGSGTRTAQFDSTENPSRKARIVMKTVTHYPRVDKSDAAGQAEQQGLSRESTIHIDMTYNEENYTAAGIMNNVIHNQHKSITEPLTSAPETTVNKPVQARVIPEIRMICATPDQIEAKPLSI